MSQLTKNDCRHNLTRKPLHVGLVTPAYSPRAGGIATYVRDLAESLCSVGQRVTVIQPTVTQYSDGPAVDVRDRFRLVRVTARGGGTAALTAYRAVRRISATDPFDVIEFANWGGLGSIHAFRKIAPQVMRVSTGIRQVVPHAPTLIAGRRMQLTTSWRIKVEAFAVRHSDAIIAPTRAQRDEIDSMYGMDPRSIRVIPFGIRIPDFVRQPRSGEPTCRFLFVGRPTIRKGFPDLIAALRLLSELTRVPFECVLVGAYPDKADNSALEQLSRAVNGRVVHRGPLSDLERDQCYREADVLLMPSRHESFGLVGVEGMAHGLPVISCRTGGIAEVIVDGVTGYLCDVANPPSLARAMAHLLERPDLRQLMGLAARARAQELFSREQMAAASLEVYRELAHRLSGAPHRQ